MSVNTVQPNAATQASTEQAKSSTQKNSLADTEAMFMTLLTTELKQQDPTAPLDPNQMVSQLTQFNLLNEVAQINQAVQNLSPNAATATQSSGGK